MNPTSRVLWSDGLFLQATHFQQQERHFEYQIQERVRIIQPHFKGFQTLKICDQSLNRGIFKILEATGLLNNAELFEAPASCPLPRHLNLLPEHEGQNVYLVLAAPSAGELSLNTHPEGSAQYNATSIDVRNVFEPETGAEPIEVVTQNLRLIAASTPPNGYAYLKLAKIKEVDSSGKVHLSHQFTPTFTNTQQSTELFQIVQGIHSLLEQKIDSIQRVNIHSFQNTAQLTDFILLQTCQRHLGVFKHYLEQKGHHPETVYKDIIALLGDLALFAQKRSNELFVVYDHDDQLATFTKLAKEIASILSLSTEQRATAIDLEIKQYGLRLAKIEKALLGTGMRFILCARADLPFTELSRRLIGTLKIGAAQQIHELVNLNLPGISVTQLTQAPRELPVYADYIYFELQTKGSTHWQIIEKTQHLAIHCSDQLPELNMELWAIRQIVKEAA